MADGPAVAYTETRRPPAPPSPVPAFPEAFIGVALTLIACSSLAAACLAADEWPQFRGPNNDGHSDATGLPLTWGETENVVWKTPIHDKGWSSPVVWGDQVWMTTATADGTQLFAVCVDRKTGNILHDIKLYEQEKQDPAHNPGGRNSYASPTPAIEEGRVYAHFGSFGTACLDTKTGEKIWERRDLKCDHWRGPASSPILYGNLLILTFDGYDAQYVIALDKKDGHTVWKKDRDLQLPAHRRRRPPQGVQHADRSFPSRASRNSISPAAVPPPPPSTR